MHGKDGKNAYGRFFYYAIVMMGARSSGIPTDVSSGS